MPNKLPQGGINSLLKTEYYILEALYDHQIEINGSKYSPLTHQEIAKLFHTSMNNIQRKFVLLIEEGYVSVGSPRRYHITSKGEYIIQLVKQARVKEQGSSG